MGASREAIRFLDFFGAGWGEDEARSLIDLCGRLYVVLALGLIAFGAWTAVVVKMWGA